MNLRRIKKIDFGLITPTFAIRKVNYLRALSLAAFPRNLYNKTTVQVIMLKIL